MTSLALREQDRKSAFEKLEVTCGPRRKTMAEPAEDLIVRNLLTALEQLEEDLDRVELWSSALGQFHRPVPKYRPNDDYLLPPQSRSHFGR
jgi:hypothetical protein